VELSGGLRPLLGGGLRPRERRSYAYDLVHLL